MMMRDGAGDNELATMLKPMIAKYKKVKKIGAPYLPLIAKVFLILTFIEDGVRVLYELDSQRQFLKSEYGVPDIIGSILVVSTVLLSFAGAALVLTKKYEKQGSYILLGFLFYQQVLYGLYSPVNSGNFGFLVRNLSLAGAFLLLIASQRVKDGRTALPGLPDPGDKATTFAYMQLASRMLMVLLSLEFLTSLGAIGTVFTLPVILAVLVGYQMPWSGLVLLGIYLLHNVLNSAFWSINPQGSYYRQYRREVLKYEFVQTISIMGGLVLLVSSGPGMLSVDERMRRKNF
mmetsp:Transcript_13049/g.40202  ORF Transcript_13049/g.40202 Transcript_13049/m.40202 type:complete len:289 (-) Transcript_13049:184-1050(-)